MNSGNEKIKFSFEYYDTSSSEYCLSKFSEEQVKKALGRLKEINSKTLNDLFRQSRVLHFNEVRWEETIKQNGFPDKRVENMEHYHFALLGVKKQLTRVYCAISSGVFYIIWFDLDHLIWPTKQKNT